MSDEDGARRKIETAIEQRQHPFILNYVAGTDIGYTLKFRQGIVDLVRSGIDERTLETPGLDRLLDEVRSAFRHLNG